METTRALMHGIIDYAGLFPPASLDMPKTVANYARYRSGEDRWALGRLVVPLKRIGEFERCAEGLLPTGDRDDSEEPWTLTVLSEAAGDEVGWLLEGGVEGGTGAFEEAAMFAVAEDFLTGGDDGGGAGACEEEPRVFFDPREGSGGGGADEGEKGRAFGGWETGEGVGVAGEEDGLVGGE